MPTSPFRALTASASLALALTLTLSLAACGSTDGTKTGSECVQSDLIAQCPPGSDPRLDAQARSACAAAGELNLIEENGSVTGSCEGEGECTVLCQFVVPCDCGVDQITDEGVFCTSCQDTAACGNNVCEGGETADSCPRDCGGTCTPGAERCNGGARQVCEQNSEWTDIACVDNETCVVSDENPALTTCTRSSP